MVTLLHVTIIIIRLIIEESVNTVYMPFKRVYSTYSIGSTAGRLIDLECDVNPNSSKINLPFYQFM